MTKVAAIQMASGPNVKANLAEAEKLIKIAVQQGADLVVLPENFAIMGLTEADKVKIAEEPGSGLLQDFLKEPNQILSTRQAYSMIIELRSVRR